MVRGSGLLAWVGALVDFLAVHVYLGRRCDAHAHLVTLDAEHRHLERSSITNVSPALRVKLCMRVSLASPCGGMYSSRVWLSSIITQ